MKGCNLDLELLVELPQCLLLKDDILVIESHLLSIAIRLGLLFLHLLFVEHLEELIFIPLRLLGIDGYFLRRGGASVLGGMSLIVDWWWTVPPTLLMALPLVVATLRVKTCLLRASSTWKRLFEEDLGLCKGDFGV